MKIDINDKTQNKDKIRRAARINQYLYEQGYGEKISESIEKNAKELMRGYGDSFGDERTTGFGRFFQSFPSMPIMIYHTNDERFLSSEFVNGIKDMIGVTGGTEWVCNLIYKLEEIVRGNVQFMDEIKKGELYIRICPTKESAEDSYKGGFIFGRSVQEYLNDHPHKIK